jgi:hypothetical protein
MICAPYLPAAQVESSIERIEKAIPGRGDRMQKKETVGAWVVHHGRKIALDANGPGEYPVIDEAAKAANLLARLGESDEVVLSLDTVRAVAAVSGINPRHELNGLLDVLERKRLISRSADQIAVLGVTTRAALAHAADLFEDAEPSKFERAAIDLGDTVSAEPIRQAELAEAIGDQYSLAAPEVADFLNRAEQIGFVDAEGDGADRLLFNGNLFRREFVEKTAKVLQSLNSAEEAKFSEVRTLLERMGCVGYPTIQAILGDNLFEKLRAAGFYDLNIVGNETGEHAYITLPSAFHKFVSPLVDDSFDMAKSLVSALTYGITARSPNLGRINEPAVLIGRLVAGIEIGPATAIGQDYRVLEVNRVIKLRQDVSRPGRYYMKLLKIEIGELALQVLTEGDASTRSLTLPSAPMSTYTAPEAARAVFRKTQSKLSKGRTRDVLESIRSGRNFK